MYHPHHMYTPAPHGFWPRAHATSAYRATQPRAHRLQRPTLACRCATLPTRASQPPGHPAPLRRPAPWPPLCVLRQTAPSMCALCSDSLPLATRGCPHASGPAWSTPTCPTCSPMLMHIPAASHTWTTSHGLHDPMPSRCTSTALMPPGMGAVTGGAAVDRAGRVWVHAWAQDVGRPRTGAGDEI